MFIQIRRCFNRQQINIFLLNCLENKKCIKVSSVCVCVILAWMSMNMYVYIWNNESNWIKNMHFFFKLKKI